MRRETERVKSSGMKPIGRMRRRPATARYRADKTCMAWTELVDSEPVGRASDAIRMPQASTKQRNAPTFVSWLLKPVRREAA